jgi:hypothetical protein
MTCSRALGAVLGVQAGHDGSEKDVLTSESLMVTRKLERGLAAFWA